MNPATTTDADSSTRTSPPSGVVADEREPHASSVLVAEGITKTYATGVWPRRRTLRVLDGADLELRRGEIVGLVGENGSGKSTLMRILVGALGRDAGTLRRSGALGYCPQEPILYERLTCDEHFELFGRAHGLQPRELDAARHDLYETFAFERWATTRVEELSGGTRSKLNLGLALVHDPDLLLLDEPYAGFDWDTYQRFWDVTSARSDRGRTLLIISHFIADESRFDRVVELQDGRTARR